MGIASHFYVKRRQKHHGLGLALISIKKDDRRIMRWDIPISFL